MALMLELGLRSVFSGRGSNSHRVDEAFKWTVQCTGYVATHAHPVLLRHVSKLHVQGAVLQCRAFAQHGACMSASCTFKVRCCNAEGSHSMVCVCHIISWCTRKKKHIFTTLGARPLPKRVVQQCMTSINVLCNRAWHQ